MTWFCQLLERRVSGGKERVKGEGDKKEGGREREEGKREGGVKGEGGKKAWKIELWGREGHRCRL